MSDKPATKVVQAPTSPEDNVMRPSEVRLMLERGETPAPPRTQLVQQKTKGAS